MKGLTLDQLESWRLSISAICFKMLPFKRGRTTFTCDGGRESTRKKLRKKCEPAKYSETEGRCHFGREERVSIDGEGDVKLDVIVSPPLLHNLQRTTYLVKGQSGSKLHEGQHLAACIAIIERLHAICAAERWGY